MYNEELLKDVERRNENGDVVVKSSGGKVTKIIKCVCTFLALFLLYEFAQVISVLSLAIKEPVFQTLLGGVAILVAIWLFIWIFKKLSWIELDLKSIDIKKCVIYLIGGNLLNFCGLFVAQLFMGEQIPENQELVIEMGKNMAIVLFFMQIVIFAPIVEEYIFRGYLQSMALKNYPKIGFLVTALLFTLVHGPNNIGSFIEYGTLATILGIICYRTKRIEYAICFHIFNNLIGFIQIFNEIS
ncbi:CAAX amino protease [Lactococcus hodotermopsidis]|uniref:CAAX amino protease n=1 Tax=Pseudolactococcus hodotermopsidis TaxID=2709157 RepID=A0A6A0BCW4_9LACT|nr:type II CAAX endopeptidase family protein [Lactococcus hodotermopsidis]GFH42553.1 CAAX amino protease [Lactococcus hodotermopsidis]